ncbi:MAG: PAS domain-containing protein, partial [Candidatus Rokuibacteriota bacterium]
MSSGETLGRIMDSISDGFVALDRKWRFVYLNRAADEVLRPSGRARDELVGKNLWAEFPELCASTFDTEFHRALAE